jgi:hypothetical protein
MDGTSFVIEWNSVSNFNNEGGASNTFEAILYETGAIKLQYQKITYAAANSYAQPTVGIENAAGHEGVQISRNDPNFAISPVSYLIRNSCGSSTTALSVGWCPNYRPGTYDPACTYQMADQFCIDNYGGQLLSLEKQLEYDVMVDLINDSTEFGSGALGQAGAVSEHWLLGLHSDGQGKWEYTDGTAADMTFLRSKSTDQLAGVQETNMVYNPSGGSGGSYQYGSSAGGLNDCCMPLASDPTGPNGWFRRGPCSHSAQSLATLHRDFLYKSEQGEA